MSETLKSPAPTLEIRELTAIQEMLDQIGVMQFLYPKLTVSKYEEYLNEMVPCNYTQIAVFENENCIAISGLWNAVKLWSGRYLEMDNVIVHPEHRSKGIGKMITGYVDKKAVALGCSNIVLDAFTTNFGAHRFYYNQGFVPKGFHFVKILDQDKLT